MKILYLDIAGYNLKLRFQNSYEKKLQQDLFSYYKQFINKSRRVTDYSIFFEKSRDFKKGKKEISTAADLNIYQFQYLLRNILQHLLSKDNGFIIHTSANNFSHKALLFLGKNGAGKSTVTDFLDAKYHSVADDSAIIKKEEGKYYLYPSPFLGKNFFIPKETKKLLVKRIFFLKKADFYKIEKIISRKEILLKLLQQLYTDKNKLKKQMSYIVDLIENFSEFYFLYFRNDKKAFLKFFLEKGIR